MATSWARSVDPAALRRLAHILGFATSHADPPSGDGDKRPLVLTTTLDDLRDGQRRALLDAKHRLARPRGDSPATAAAPSPAESSPEHHDATHHTIANSGRCRPAQLNVDSAQAGIRQCHYTAPMTDRLERSV